MAAWLRCSGMQAKIPKCACLGLQASNGKKIDLSLSLDGKLVPYAPSGVTFLGMTIDVSSDQSKLRATVLSSLEDMLTRIDACPLSRKQKLLIYRAGVCLRLTWLLSIKEFPISWVEKSLDALTSKYLKRWAGLARSANTAPLYLTAKNGGLNLPLIVTPQEAPGC